MPTRKQSVLFPELFEGMERPKPVNVASVPQRSPFRYPGGKTWFVPTFRQWMGRVHPKPSILVEPFAGGGIISLTAIFENLVEKTVMVELDDEIAAVWQSIVNGEAEWLANRILTFDLTKETVIRELKKTPSTQREKAFQTILKNRTFHGGILAEGAGFLKYGENGKGILSRWYPGTLAKRLLNLKHFASRIDFRCDDGLEVMQEFATNPAAVFFMDPPYTAGGKKAGNRLYKHYNLDHERLFTVCELLKGDFVITYDNAEEVKRMARNHRFQMRLIPMTNTHHATMEELVIGKDLSWMDRFPAVHEPEVEYAARKAKKKHPSCIRAGLRKSAQPLNLNVIPHRELSMHLTTGGSTLSRKLIRLIETHDNVAIVVAWASAETEAFKVLKKHRGKIRRAVIGTHFYQTHPDVLENFIGCNEVRFILQPQGVFHPKAYLFWSKKSWDILIGSANLTAGALDKNSELMLHISSDDTHSGIQLQLQNQIDEYWAQGEVVTAESVSTYHALWQAQQPALKRVSGEYSSGSKSKAPVHTEIMSMSWQSFFRAVQADPYHGFNERCDLLDLVRKAFRESGAYSEMDLGLRKTIAGLPNDFNDHWGWFGSMKGAGYFHQAVNENNPHLSAALDIIPLDGAVAHEHYNSYVKEFTKAFPDGRHGVGVASRLLALKRPDYFVCLDSKNRAQLCKDFGIKQTGMTYDRYWDDVVCRIVDSVWWNEPKPTDRKAIRVWLGRAAMLDAIFYQP